MVQDRERYTRTQTGGLGDHLISETTQHAHPDNGEGDVTSLSFMEIEMDGSVLSAHKEKNIDKTLFQCYSIS